MQPKKLCFLVSAFICLMTATAFAGQADYSILFKTGTLIPESNLEDFITAPQPASDQQFDGKYFRLIQFNAIPTAAQKVELANAGFRLISYFPNFAFWTEIRANASKEILRNYAVRSVIDVNPINKLDREIAAGNFPSYAMHGKNEIDLQIGYYKGLNSEMVQSAFTHSGFEIVQRYDYSSWMVVRVPVTKIGDITAMPFVASVTAVAPPSEPDDEQARSLHRSSTINRTDAPIGRHYSGAGVSAALGDDGPVGPHIDYQGRIDQSNTTANVGNHGDMTVGILMGAGNIDPTIKGMATGAFIYVYDIGGYAHVLNSPSLNANQGVMVTSTSYSQGCNDYTTDTQTGDQILNQNPTLLHVYSAGNNGTGDCGYGAGNNWGNITGGYKQGKNVIACGNLNYLDVLENSSSRGPASDGRIKPDICANGINQLSTDGPNSYQVGGGTSAACPGIAGIVTQLHQAYRDLNAGQNADGGLVKACLLNSAEDLGNPGPDYKFGWGRVNAFRAVTTLEDNRYMVGTISQGGNDTYNITVPSGTNQVRIMVYWTDFEGDPLAAKSLVNDLNMTVTDPNSIVYNPWVLNPAPNAATLNANATRAVDDLNNVEQVTIDLPVAGSYTINIDGFMVPQGPETYYLVYEFRGDEVNVTYPIGYEGFVPGETETIRWDAYGNNGTFNLEYSTDLGNSWNSIAPAVAANARYYNWLVPSAVTSEALIRVTRGAVTGQSDDAFSIIGLPQNITVDWACPDSIRLSWSSVTGAVGYEVSVLGANYMDSVTYTTGTYAILTGLNPLVDQWFSVKAYSAANAKGRRANAIYKAPGVFACPIQLDAAVTQLVAPASTTLLDCNDLTGVEISIELQNSGVNPISSIPVFYRINGGTPVSETFPGTITSFATANYTFSATADFSVIGSYDLQIWADYAGDGNHYNDTISIVINSVPGVLASLPFTENFESFTNCSVATNCEQTVCGLTNGWVNDENLVIDDIDWRVSEGATASVATGPDFDHNPGTATGNYLYTEASACFNRTARVITPCIDLTSTTAPQLEFWYHMYGVAMGSLHVDVLSNDIWTLDVMTPISGDQGNSWHQATVDLSAFNGSIATIRFRGITGPDYTSDMAIDDINIYELSAPPVTNFIASATNLCPGQTITLTDLSVNSPQSWDWVITPSTGFAYTGGTSSSSQNPQIQFTAPGIYDVSLTATNGFGNNTYAISSYIVVGSGAAVPLLETFQSGTFPPLNWNVENPDGAITWVNAQVTGSNGNQTDAAYINNYAYNVPGEEDGLISIRVDLSASIYPIVTFDVANATYSPNFNDALRIDISTDCGVTFAPTGYLKVGPGLATVLNQTNSWAPGQASDWRNDTLDLSAYIGSDVVLKFVNVTDYGNNTYLDNINYSELPLSVNDVDGSGIMAVLYPNPSQGEVTLNMNTVQGGPVEFTFTDVRGARIKTVSEVTGSGFTSRKFDLHDFNAGIYFIEIKTPNGSSRLKYIKL